MLIIAKSERKEAFERTRGFENEDLNQASGG